MSPEVLQLALQGQKIQAIKILREQTGLGLKESKDIVDGLAP
ncbi:ribosomal protein L7/L12 [Mycolicibacterium sp. Dal123E01]